MTEKNRFDFLVMPFCLALSVFAFELSFANGDYLITSVSFLGVVMFSFGFLKAIGPIPTDQVDDAKADIYRRKL